MNTETHFSLSCQNLSLARNGVGLFRGLDITLQSGDLLIIQGSNGAGKSSLLMALAGLLRPAEGSIMLGEGALEAHPRYPSHALYIGHKRGLYAQMSVLENVAFWARMGGNDETIDAALHYFDLEDIQDFPLRLLSEGWKQRVVLTRLLTMPNKLWLLDEPTANLDNECISLLHSLISTRIEQGGIVLMTTHAQVKGERFKILNINDYKEKSHVKSEEEGGITYAAWVDA